MAKQPKTPERPRCAEGGLVTYVDEEGASHPDARIYEVIRPGELVSLFVPRGAGEMICRFVPYSYVKQPRTWHLPGECYDPDGE